MLQTIVLSRGYCWWFQHVLSLSNIQLESMQQFQLLTVSPFRCHPQNRKYITYRNVARGDQQLRPRSTCTEKIWCEVLGLVHGGF